jgi:hypothetical protein
MVLYVDADVVVEVVLGGSLGESCVEPYRETPGEYSLPLAISVEHAWEKEGWRERGRGGGRGGGMEGERKRRREGKWDEWLDGNKWALVKCKLVEWTGSKGKNCNKENRNRMCERKGMIDSKGLQDIYTL